MASTDEPLAPSEFWERVKKRFIREFPGFHEEVAIPVPGRRLPATAPSLVGTWAGRMWQLDFLEPRLLSPDMQVGVTTAVRLVDPARMPDVPIPWLYVGARLGVFTRGSAGTDRIIGLYRLRRLPMKGAGTGNAELDRKWAVFPSDPDLASVFRIAEVQATLQQFAALSPNKELPVLAVFGSEATLTLPTGSSSARVGRVVTAFQGLSRVLDRLEEVRGLPPASRAAIPMDLMHDELGSPFPLARWTCPWCHQTVHPRFQPNLGTEVCEKCGKGFYVWK